MSAIAVDFYFLLTFTLCVRPEYERSCSCRWRHSIPLETFVVIRSAPTWSTPPVETALRFVLFALFGHDRETKANEVSDRSSVKYDSRSKWDQSWIFVHFFFLYNKEHGNAFYRLLEWPFFPVFYFFFFANFCRRLQVSDLSAKSSLWTALCCISWSNPRHHRYL